MRISEDLCGSMRIYTRSTHLLRRHLRAVTAITITTTIYSYLFMFADIWDPLHCSQGIPHSIDPVCLTEASSPAKHLRASDQDQCRMILVKRDNHWQPWCVIENVQTWLANHQPMSCTMVVQSTMVCDSKQPNCQSVYVILPCTMMQKPPILWIAKSGGGCFSR